MSDQPAMDQAKAEAFVHRVLGDTSAALPSRLQSFETEILAAEENFAGLAAINRELIARVDAVDAPQRIVLDMDSTEIPVYGRQEQSAYNGHFESTCDSGWSRPAVGW
jgi:Transposase DDE domain group 1